MEPEPGLDSHWMLLWADRVNQFQAAITDTKCSHLPYRGYSDSTVFLPPFAIKWSVLLPCPVNLTSCPNSVVGLVAQSVQRLAMGRTIRGSNPGGGEIFRTCPDWPQGPPSLLCNGYWVFPGGTEQPGRDADPSPPSSAVVMKEQSYTSTPPMGRTACTEPQCLYKGTLYLLLQRILVEAKLET